MKSVFIACIRFYQNWISPLFPATCRFFPSCSTYAMEAVERFGVWRGTALAVRRLIKCHPWHPGGFDPVPAKEETRAAGKGQTSGRKSLPNPAFR